MSEHILNEKRCIIIVTHDDRIFSFADRILKMEDGRLIGIERGGKPMRNKIIFFSAGIGLEAGTRQRLHVYSEQPTAQPPVFNPAANPYADGIYANGIIESSRPTARTSIFTPKSPGRSPRFWYPKARKVQKGEPLLTIDDSVQRATTEQ